MKSIALCAAVLACAAATAAPAAVLYKSVGANGTVEFSDVVPDKGRNVERMHIPDSAPASQPTTMASGPSREESLRETDAAVARANAQLDLAEHALAEARRSVSNDGEGGLRMVMLSSRRSRADDDRLAFYKKDVLLARAQLLEVLKDKRKADAIPQVYTASNEWLPYAPPAIPTGRR